MTREEAIEKLKSLPVDDPEAAHGIADNILLEFLAFHGYGDVAEAWEDACEDIGFWYA